jgi:hypothetical protein
MDPFAPQAGNLVLSNNTMVHDGLGVLYIHLLQLFLDQLTIEYTVLSGQFR